MAHREALHGCIPILVTPFADDGSLDLESLEREIDWVLAEGASGVACVAIASEGYKLTESERDAVIADHVSAASTAACRSSPPRTVPVRSRPSTAPAAPRRSGADALMVLPSYFVKPGPDALDVVLRAHRRGVRAPDHAAGRAAVDGSVDGPGALGSHGRGDSRTSLHQGRGDTAGTDDLRGARGSAAIASASSAAGAG